MCGARIASGSLEFSRASTEIGKTVPLLQPWHADFQRGVSHHPVLVLAHKHDDASVALFLKLASSEVIDSILDKVQGVLDVRLGRVGASWQGRLERGGRVGV